MSLASRPDRQEMRLLWRPRSLHARISIGFVGVLSLHVVVALMSHVGLQRAADSAVENRARQAQLTRVLQTDREVVALQRNVLAFMYTGDSNLAEHVRSSAAELESSLVAFDASLESSGAGQVLPRMSEALHAYRKEFDAVVTDRGRRERLLQQSVLPFAARYRRVLGAVIDEAGRTNDSALAAKAGACLQTLSDAEGAVSTYLLEPGGDVVRTFQERSAAGRLHMGKIDRAQLPRELAIEVDRLQLEIPAWQSSFLDVVNSTRSYLHLVNVVLAGQALEFLTLSSRFTDASIEAQATVDARLAASQERYRTIANAIGLLTVLGGLIAGWRIATSVAKPITALTATFTGLARGNDEAIAGLDHEDEIGEMARAAEVFAMRNRETRALLANANELGAQQTILNEELEQHVIELRARNEELDSFSYSASHDLRAPLRSISLLADWIREDSADSLSGESAEHLDLLQRRVRRLEALLDGLLEYARIGRSEDLAEPVDLLPLLEETVDSLDADDSVQVTVTGDNAHLVAPRVAVQKVVQNLISNAISHHNGHHPKVDVRVFDRQDSVVIEVEDDGPGIPEELQERAFQIFQTLRPRDEHESSGIGLAIVQKLAQAHGAVIQLESDGASGALFRVIWPKSKASDVKAPLPAPDQDLGRTDASEGSLAAATAPPITRTPGREPGREPGMSRSGSAPTVPGHEP